MSGWVRDEGQSCNRRDTHISVESCVVAHGVDRGPCFGWLVLGGGVSAHTHLQVAVGVAARERDILLVRN